MSQTRLAYLERLEQSATPGPWSAILGRHRTVQAVSVWRGTPYMGNYLAPHIVASNGQFDQAIADAQFIAESRTAIPQLLAHIRQTSRELRRLQRLVDQSYSPGCVPGSLDQTLPPAILAGRPAHHYLSTACDDAVRYNVRDLHKKCRHTCKYCAAACLCSCHLKDRDHG